MQNDRGQFRCYRYCFIGEKYHRGENVDATETRGRQSSVSSFGILSRTSLIMCTRKKTFWSEPHRKNGISRAYRQCGGQRDVLSSTVRSSSIPQISPLIADLADILDKYSILTIFVSEISLVVRRAFTFTLTPHCVRTVRKLGKDLEGSTLRIAAGE